MKECLNYKIIDSETLECHNCNHFCRIKEGKVGICGIRQNRGGKLYLLTYGKAVAANIDPIEKKPLFHFLPGSLAYSFGTLGCNFRCSNCQNYAISQMFGEKGKVKEYSKLNWGLDFSPAKIVEEAKQNDCSSIAATYNEPTVFMEYSLEVMKIAKKEKIYNIWVSNGFMSSETLDIILPYLDAVNIDIKSFQASFYKRYCGAKLTPVLENCKKLAKQKNVWLEVTTLLIPNLSDDLKMLREIARFIKKELGASVPWHLSAFSGEISWKLKNFPPTPLEKIRKAYEIGKEEGLNYVYGGNIEGENIENTYCPKCGTLLVERNEYWATSLMKNDRCPRCGAKIAGVFK